MERDDKSLVQVFNDLNNKNKQIHAQRLKKLHLQISNPDQVLPQPGHSRFETTTNSKYAKILMKEKTNSLNYTIKKQILITPVQKHTYFHNQSLKNIDHQNKILFKKIQRIVKGNKKKPTQTNKNQQKHLLSNLQDDQSENQINATFLAEEMSKNRATREQIKQKQIKDANLKMLERLMNMKPTIQTRKILTQTQKNKETSQRLSRFNTFLATDSEKDESQKDFVQGQVGKKRLSLDTRALKKQEDEICKDCNYHIKDKKKFSTGYENNLQQTQNIKYTNYHRRTATQPIEHFSQIKLPYITSPSNSNNFTTMTNADDLYRPNRSKSTNNRYYQTTKYQQSKRNGNKFLIKLKRSNSVNNDNVTKSHQTTTNKLKQQIITDSNQQFQQSLNEKKVIVLGRVQKLIEGQLINFVFIRSSVLYEIHIYQRERGVDSNEKSMKKNKKTDCIPQHLKQQYNRGVIHFKKQKKQIKTSKDIIEQKKQFKNLQIAKSFKQSRIILNQVVGSSLFSYFDYDYNRIIEQCLELRRTIGNGMEVLLKEEFYNFHEPKSSKKYRNQSIREDDQDQEED